jgi:hypothetical protein
MKNVLIYTHPEKKIKGEDETLLKIQIDNSLDLGWKREDILLMTNFPFEYNGIVSLIVKDGLYYDFDLAASKIPVVLDLLGTDVIDKDELYWCHDLDAYENARIVEDELQLAKYDVGLVHYFYKPEWTMSSFFFKKSAFDILDLLHKTSIGRPWRSRNNEKTLTWLIKHNKIELTRYKKLNVTYNITKRYIPIVYKEATKPIKILHFRPSDHDARMPDTALNMFMYGKNSLKIPLMSDRLVKIFTKHGIT